MDRMRCSSEVGLEGWGELLLLLLLSLVSSGVEPDLDFSGDSGTSFGRIDEVVRNARHEAIDERARMYAVISRRIIITERDHKHERAR